MKPTVGPVPAGKYWIVDRPEDGLRLQVNAGVRDLYNHVVNGTTFRHNEWFALWRDDWGIDDYTWIEGLNEVTSVCILARYQKAVSLCYMIQILPYCAMHY